jgi:hypothetical protein
VPYSATPRAPPSADPKVLGWVAPYLYAEKRKDRRDTLASQDRRVKSHSTLYLKIDTGQAQELRREGYSDGRGGGETGTGEVDVGGVWSRTVQANHGRPAAPDPTVASRTGAPCAAASSRLARTSRPVPSGRQSVPRCRAKRPPRCQGACPAHDGATSGTAAHTGGAATKQSTHGKGAGVGSGTLYGASALGQPWLWVWCVPLHALPPPPPQHKSP